MSENIKPTCESTACEIAIEEESALFDEVSVQVIKAAGPVRPPKPLVNREPRLNYDEVQTIWSLKRLNNAWAHAIAQVIFSYSLKKTRAGEFPEEVQEVVPKGQTSPCYGRDPEFFPDEPMAEDYLPQDFDLRAMFAANKKRAHRSEVELNDFGRHYLMVVEKNDKFCEDLGNYHRKINAARKVCKGCPFISKCLTQSILQGERHGVWGGMQERDRCKVMSVVTSLGRDLHHGRMKAKDLEAFVEMSELVDGDPNALFS